jgi:hypothetical protein
MEEEVPKDNFREMSIIPSVSELKTMAPAFLRQIKDKGKFNDLEQYLDTLFRLNREDCF